MVEAEPVIGVHQATTHKRKESILKSQVISSEQNQHLKGMPSMGQSLELPASGRRIMEPHQEIGAHLIKQKEPDIVTQQSIEVFNAN